MNAPHRSLPDLVTLAQLQMVAPQSGDKAALYLPWLNHAMFEFGIVSQNRVAHFLAQIVHESGQLKHTSENLNYSAEGLQKTFRKYFPSQAQAQAYARQPEKIANRVYANRMGNGNEASGMGWRHRGAGLIQLTGHNNQQQCAAYFGLDTDKVGDWLRTPEGACRSAAWFWFSRYLNAYAEANNLDAVSDLINLGRLTATVGDTNGYADRAVRLQLAQEALK